MCNRHACHRIRPHPNDLSSKYLNVISWCAPDTCVFSTDASTELAWVGETFGLSADKVAEIALAPLDHVFEPEREEMRGRFADAAAAALRAEPEQAMS